VRYFHVPLVLDEAGRRLAKRADDLSLAELRASGTDPRAIVAWVARSAGIACEDRVSAGELVSSFAFDKLDGAPVRLSARELWQLRNAR
jgi:glutamyl-tRNA synthetase